MLCDNLIYTGVVDFCVYVDDQTGTDGRYRTSKVNPQKNKQGWRLPPLNYGRPAPATQLFSLIFSL